MDCSPPLFALDNGFLLLRGSGMEPSEKDSEGEKSQGCRSGSKLATSPWWQLAPPSPHAVPFLDVVCAEGLGAEDPAFPST